MVVADASGVLSTQAVPAAQTLTLAGNSLSISGGNSVTLPSATNIYNTDGTLTGARTVTMGNNDLTFSGSGVLQKLSGASTVPSVVRLGRTSQEFEMGVAGAASHGFAATTAGDAWIKSTGAKSDMYFGSSSSGAIKFVTKNQIAMGVDTLGNIAIGNNGAQATEKLSVNGGSSPVAINVANTFGSARIAIGAAAGSYGLSNAGDFMLQNTANKGLALGTNGDNVRLYISNTGVVSINNLAGTGSRMVVADASGALSTQAVPSTSNIYNADGALSGPRTVNLATNNLNFQTAAGSLTMSSGHANAGPRLFSTDSLEIQAGSNPYQIALLPNGYTSIGGVSAAAGYKPVVTSKIVLNGSVANSINRISSATTLNDNHHTVIANAFTAGFTITLPTPSSATGRVYVIRKVDESSNAITFTFAGITGTNAIRVSDTSATAGAYINSLNYVKTLRIQSDGTDWYLLD